MPGRWRGPRPEAHRHAGPVDSIPSLGQDRRPTPEQLAEAGFGLILLCALLLAYLYTPVGPLVHSFVRLHAEHVGLVEPEEVPPMPPPPPPLPPPPAPPQSQ